MAINSDKWTSALGSQLERAKREFQNGSVALMLQLSLYREHDISNTSRDANYHRQTLSTLMLPCAAQTAFFSLSLSLKRVVCFNG